MGAGVSKGGHAVPSVHRSEHNEAANAKQVLLLGFDGTDFNLVDVDSTGAVAVTGVSGMGGTEFDDGDAIDTDSQGTLLMGTTDVPGTARAVITDNDGHLQVDVLSGTVSVGNFPASQTIDDGGLSITVDGTVAVSNFPASIPTGAEKAEDSAHGSGDSGYLIFGVTKVTPGTLVDSDNDYTPFQMTAAGRLRIDTGALYNEDSQHTNADPGLCILGVRRDSNTSPVSDTNDYHTLIFDSNGRLKVSVPSGVGQIGQAISEGGHDLQAAAFSETTAISDQYRLNAVELNFSSTEQRIVTVTTSNGTVLLSRQNTATSMLINLSDLVFASGEELTVDVTQTAGACTLECYLRTM